MSNFKLRGRAGDVDHIKASGSGEQDDPYVLEVKAPGPDGIYSAQIIVGTIATALPNVEMLSGGAIFKADHENAGDIYLGPIGVTTSSGYLLEPGEAVPLSAKNLSAVFAIATQNSQKLYVLGS